ncbi:GNAT family N-acetyltransferase [Deinococcus arenicola]|uniref:GNAT family N-acetyltransferase n=1 Tax=Deinococcus arenicola TaxID=2994950 RepID=A0ABU4DSR4_9DEIO|nr:GNAT family N-acetyltransferase [Deinococcus sp. ZS9-10]MDV6375473.1 GNAT family N-acetyltransferase [Deinococcus sp. ZS9-10]
MSDPVIRRVLPTDEARLGEIAYLTGFFGNSAGKYFPDPQLFADLWVRAYFRLPDAVGYVGQVDGNVIGYIIGSVNETAYRRALGRVVAGTVLPGVLTRRYSRPLLALPYLTRTLRFPSLHASETDFPAHLHLNLLPQSRGLGLGRGLLKTFLERLEARGVPGVQLSTTDENEAALGLYTKAGFTVAASRKTELWTPWLGHAARQMSLIRQINQSSVRRSDTDSD